MNHLPIQEILNLETQFELANKKFSLSFYFEEDQSEPYEPTTGYIVEREHALNGSKKYNTVFIRIIDLNTNHCFNLNVDNKNSTFYEGTYTFTNHNTDETTYLVLNQIAKKLKQILEGE